MQAVWAHVTPKTVLAPPSAEAKQMLSCKSIDVETGEIESGKRRSVSECFRVDAKGRIVDTQDRLLSSASAHAKRDEERRRSRATRYEDRQHYYYSRGEYRDWSYGGWQYNDGRQWRNWGGWGWR